MSIILDGTTGVTTPNIISPTQTISTKLDLTGGQIKFPVTQVPSADANTLDDYEEGTFTPSWTANTTNPTLGNGTLTGLYTKVGKIVTASIQLAMGSTTTYGSGWYNFSLPFPVESSQFGPAIIIDSSAYQYLTGVACASYSSCTVSNGTPGQYSMTYATSPITFASGDAIYFSITYKTTT